MGQMHCYQLSQSIQQLCLVCILQAEDCCVPRTALLHSIGGALQSLHAYQLAVAALLRCHVLLQAGVCGGGELPAVGAGWHDGAACCCCCCC
jgi:hypothetical protein